MQFAKIVFGTVLNQIPYLMGKVCCTVAYTRHIHAFVVECLNEYILFRPSDLIDPFPLEIYEYKKESVIVLRHGIQIDMN